MGGLAWGRWREQVWELAAPLPLVQWATVWLPTVRQPKTLKRSWVREATAMLERVELVDLSDEQVFIRCLRGTMWV